MVDIHSHVLPGIDDGSRSVEESVCMLAQSARQGINQMVATPHFYPMESSPEQFLRRRATAEKALRAAWQPDVPALRMGAEGYYLDGISRNEMLEELRIEGTELLLLEMPFSAWSERMLREVQELQSRSGITVLLAHIERYLRFQKPTVWEDLRQAGVLMQSNGEFFLHWRTRKKALRMLKAGQIHMLGSDCHNLESRPPNLGQALERLDAVQRQRLEEIQRSYLPEPAAV